MIDRSVWRRIPLVSVLLCGAYAIQCSTTQDDVGPGTGPAAGSGGRPLDLTHDAASTKDVSSEAFFANDPPPPNCSDAGVPAKVPSGTPECPDDKNYEGCPCTSAGATAACWPGLRKNRNKGDCKDGVTTCMQTKEFSLAWGPCKGYQGITPPTYLPPEGATGKAACTCFSGGYWDVKNLAPCFYTVGATTGAVSSTFDPSNPDNIVCPDPSTFNVTDNWFTGTTPTTPFSANSLNVDCNGYFKLCFAIKSLSAVGASKNSATDCQIMRVCTEGYYDQAGKGANGGDGEEAFPDLPGWITKTDAENACVQAFIDNGGYGEFSVHGTSDECDAVDETFLTFDYCPWACGDPNPPPECAGCTNGAGAPF